ncbi:MAG: TetR/AcrR family transcriptional regulator [Spirochaetales bacterium]|nr:TetR/AcrR family transcriptional regulator [Spirochaetales bacterium]
MSDLAPKLPDWPYTKAKTALLRAAALVMSEQGPRAATLKNVATRAGVTEPAIFRHFPGVNGIFAALCDTLDLFHDRFDALFAEKPSGLARFEHGVRGSLDILVASPDYAYLVLHAESVFRGYPELMRRVAERRERVMGTIAAAFEEALASGELKEGSESAGVALLAGGAFAFAAIRWLERPESGDPFAAGYAAWQPIRKLLTRKR